MITNHTTTALRYLIRNRTATLINVTGLAVALSAAFLMLQYLDFELSYDRYLPEHEQVFRVTTSQSENGIARPQSAETFFGVADWLTQTFPEVEASTRFYRWPANTGTLFQSAEGKLYNEKNYLYADKSFFKVFPSLLISGNAETCLAESNKVVMSDRMAMKIFGTTDVIGKTISDPARRNLFLQITGVMRHTPDNSHFDIDVIQPAEWLPDPGKEWKHSVWTYLRVKKGTDLAGLEKKMNSGLVTMLPKGTSASLTLQPLASIHLRSQLESENKTPGNILYIYIVAGALALIMVIAWINYVNLETARFLKRLKEVGIRRIVGSSKGDLFARFFTEFLCVTAIAVVCGVIITFTVFPWFGYITGLPLTKPEFRVTGLWSVAIAVSILATVVAGVYPFISVMKLNLVSSLKGKISDSIRGVFVRKSLLTFQFVASLTLMALVVMVSLQLDFMRSVRSNFDYSQVITVFNPANYTYVEDSLRQPMNEGFRNKLFQSPSIASLTTSSAIPGEAIGFTYVDLAKRSLSDPDRQVPYKVMYIDYDFIPTFGLELVAGRNYSREYSNVLNLVVTESTIRELGFKSPEEALNQQIYFMEDDWDKWTIIGVVKDYRHESVKTPVKPGIFRLHRNKGQMVYYSVKVNEGSKPEEAISAIETAWNETWPGKPFDYFFMDQHYDQQYKSEIHFSRIFFLFSAIAVFIACLGVMGMSLFEANARTKEIGIRKVLGAHAIHIITLLTKDSFRLLVGAFVIALPLVYFLSSRWLTEYPERIEFSAWFLVVPLSVMLILVAIVSGSQVVKSAVRNPVDSLKEE